MESVFTTTSSVTPPPVDGLSGKKQQHQHNARQRNRYADGGFAIDSAAAWPKAEIGAQAVPEIQSGGHGNDAEGDTVASASRRAEE